MRKIRSQEEIEKSEKKKKRILTFFILIILLGSTAGYAFLSSDGSNVQTDPGIQNQGAGWSVNVGDRTLLFKNHPASVDVPVNIAFNLQNYVGKSIYIDSENEGVTYEIATTLGQYVYRMHPACYGPCTRDLPEKTCDDIMIVWKHADENKVYQEDNCVFIEGDIRAADAFLFKVFGIEQ